MKFSPSLLRCAAAALAIAAATPLAAQDQPAAAAEAAAQFPLTPQGAKDWIASVEADFAAFSKEFAHVSWLNATYINHDSDTLAAKYGAELTLKQVGYANEAARYAAIEGLDAETTRKLDMLRNSISLPAPARDGCGRGTERHRHAPRLGLRARQGDAQWRADQRFGHRGRDGQSRTHARRAEGNVGELA